MKHIKATLTVFLLCLTLAACQASQQTENETTAPPPTPVTVLANEKTTWAAAGLIMFTKWSCCRRIIGFHKLQGGSLWVHGA